MAKENAPQVIAKGEDGPAKGPQNAKERLYDRVKVPVWALDVIIGLCAITIVYLIVTGR